VTFERLERESVVPRRLERVGISARLADGVVDFVDGVHYAQEASRYVGLIEAFVTVYKAFRYFDHRDPVLAGDTHVVEWVKRRDAGLARWNRKYPDPRIVV